MFGFGFGFGCVWLLWGLWSGFGCGFVGVAAGGVVGPSRRFWGNVCKGEGLVGVIICGLWGGIRGGLMCDYHTCSVRIMRRSATYCKALSGSDLQGFCVLSLEGFTALPAVCRAEAW